MLANGTIRTIEDEEDIYISLTSLCEYFTQSSVNMKKEIRHADPKDKRYAAGLYDMMHTIAQEVVELGKFEAQRRMINSPEDLLKMIDKNPFGKVE
jgi:hypothetical protein